MFSAMRTHQKKIYQDEVETGDKQGSSPQKSVEEDQKPDAVVPNNSATTVSTLTEAPKEKARKTSWWRMWFRRKRNAIHPTPVKEDVADFTNLPSASSEKSVDLIKESEAGEAGVQEAPPTADTAASAATETDTKKKKKHWWHQFRLHKKKQKSKSADEKEGAEISPPSVKEDVDSNRISDELPTDRPTSGQFTLTGRGGSVQAESNITSASTETLSREELVNLGFPNLAQTCYMNSTLQGLLTLTRFVQEVHNQQKVWSSHPKCQLISGFVEVGLCRSSKTKAEKKQALAAFKETVAEFNSEFEDDSQKDTHEFLSCVLDGLRSLSIDLHTAAVNRGISYTCPVDAHIAFQMLSTRTCKGCCMQSMRDEDFINLSLDLVPGGSVSQCLQEYLKESQLEYRCECGAQESSQQWSFLTLPNVLILQLKRFRFTESYQLMKVNSPIILSRELVVGPESSVTEQTRYSLVSIISHLGSSGHSGHYICDGVHRWHKPGDMTDCWLTYNDSKVSETTGSSVGRERLRTAYLLFYEKQE